MAACAVAAVAGLVYQGWGSIMAARVAGREQDRASAVEFAEFGDGEDGAFLGPNTAGAPSTHRTCLPRSAPAPRFGRGKLLDEETQSTAEEAV